MKKVEVIFPEALQGQANELKKWLTSQEFLDNYQIETRNESSNETLGVLELIEIVLASKAIVELVKCINTWIKANRINSKFKIKLKDSEFEMSFENLKNEDKIIKEIREILKDDKE